jgi:tyrosine-protein phosphatase SIW14
MARKWQTALGIIGLSLVAAVPVLYGSHRHTTLRNLRVVEDDVLYRSGQLTPAGLERVIHEHGIRTVVTLRTARTPGNPSPDAWEEDLCARRGLKHVRIVPRVWGADEKGEIPAEQAVQEFLRVMDDKTNHPVLLHCFAGIHRTGTMCAIFRMEYHRWNIEPTLQEMQRYGFDPADMHEHIEGYLRNYRPRWKATMKR